MNPYPRVVGRLRTAPSGPAARPVAGPLAWSLAGTAASALSQWAVILVLARLTSPATVGLYALGLAVSAPVVLLAGLALRTVEVTESGSRFTLADYLRLRVAGMGVALAVIAVVATFGPAGSGAVVMLVGLAKALDGVGDIYFGFFQRHDEMRLIATSLCLNGVATVVAMTGLLVATGSIVVATAGSVAASAVASVAYCRRAARPLLATMAGAATASAGAAGAGAAGAAAAGVAAAAGAQGARRERSLRTVALLGTAAPLGLASALASLNVNLPRYLLSDRLGAAQLGVFAVLGYVMLVAGLGFGAASQVVLPRMARLYANADLAGVLRLTARLGLGSLAVGTVAVPVVALAGPPVLRLLYGPPYAAQVPTLVLLTVASGLSGAVYFLNAALSATRRYTNQLAVNVATCALCLGSGAVLIPRAGLRGAAATVLVTVAGDCLAKAVMVARLAFAERGRRAGVRS